MPESTTFELASSPDRTAFKPPSMDGSGVVHSLHQTGRRVTGSLALVRRNPRGRINCKVDYTVPESWTLAHHHAALRLVAHWFRDIGGFQTLAKKHLCHIVARLAEGCVELDLHDAVKAYAESDWHKEAKRWTTLGKFFDSRHDFLERWLTIATDQRRQQEEDAKRRRQAAQYQADRDAANKRQAKADRAAMRRRGEQRKRDAAVRKAEEAERLAALRKAGDNDPEALKLRELQANLRAKHGIAEEAATR